MKGRIQLVPCVITIFEDLLCCLVIEIVLLLRVHVTVDATVALGYAMAAAGALI